MYMTICDHQKIVDERSRDLKEMEQEYTIKSSALKREIAKHKSIIDLVIRGGDVNKIALGKEIVYQQGDCNSMERKKAKDDAIKNLLSERGTALKNCFMGVKQYAGFGDQGCNCEYGMGPTYGSIVFEVGMHKEYRKKKLTDEEIEAAIHYLAHL